MDASASIEHRAAISLKRTLLVRESLIFIDFNTSNCSSIIDRNERQA
jgi:hypothetical protein